VDKGQQPQQQQQDGKRHHACQEQAAGARFCGSMLRWTAHGHYKRDAKLILPRIAHGMRIWNAILLSARNTLLKNFNDMGFLAALYFLLKLRPCLDDSQYMIA
jgi:hypothetical protein